MPRPRKNECPTEKPSDEPIVEKTRKPRKSKKEQPEEPAVVAEKPVPKSAEKKKRQMSQAQLDALARGREALAKRRQEKKSVN